MTREEAVALTQELQAAVQRRDVGRLEALLAPEFTLTTGRPGAPVRTREDYLATTATGYVIDAFAFEELDAIELGDSAVVRSRYRQSGSLHGADRTGFFLITDVWALRDGVPQLVTRHSSALEDA